MAYSFVHDDSTLTPIESNRPTQTSSDFLRNSEAVTYGSNTPILNNIPCYNGAVADNHHPSTSHDASVTKEQMELNSIAGENDGKEIDYTTMVKEIERNQTQQEKRRNGPSASELLNLYKKELREKEEMLTQYKGDLFATNKQIARLTQEVENYKIQIKQLKTELCCKNEQHEQEIKSINLSHATAMENMEDRLMHKMDIIERGFTSILEDRQHGRDTTTHQRQRIFGDLKCKVDNGPMEKWFSLEEITIMVSKDQTLFVAHITSGKIVRVTPSTNRSATIDDFIDMNDYEIPYQGWFTLCQGNDCLFITADRTIFQFASGTGILRGDPYENSHTVGSLAAVNKDTVLFIEISRQPSIERLELNTRENRKTTLRTMLNQEPEIIRFGKNKVYIYERTANNIHVYDYKTDKLEGQKKITCSAGLVTISVWSDGNLVLVHRDEIKKCDKNGKVLLSLKDYRIDNMKAVSISGSYIWVSQSKQLLCFQQKQNEEIV